MNLFNMKWGNPNLYLEFSPPKIGVTGLGEYSQAMLLAVFAPIGRFRWIGFREKCLNPALPTFTYESFASHLNTF